MKSLYETLKERKDVAIVKKVLNESESFVDTFAKKGLKVLFSYNKDGVLINQKIVKGKTDAKAYFSKHSKKGEYVEYYDFGTQSSEQWSKIPVDVSADVSDEAQLPES